MSRVDNEVNIPVTATDGASKTIKGIYTEISGLNRTIKEEDQEWQKLSLTIDKAKDPVRYYTEQNKHLTTQMGLLEQKSQLLRGAIDKSKTAKGEDTKQTEKLRGQLAALELQEAKTGAQITKNTTLVDQNSNAFKRALTHIKEHQLQLQMSLMTMNIVSSAVFASVSLGFKSTVKESNELKNSLIGLSSVAEGTGAGMNEAQAAAVSLASDGLMTVSDAATSLKNLLMRGYGMQEAIDIMLRFKDSAAFGRQASLSFGESIRGATEGLKNENSILVDNAGVTKNVSQMWKEYAKELGVGVQSLTTAQKRQAEYNGIMQETRFQVGDAAKLSAEFAGQQAKTAAETKLLKAAIGESLEPTLKGLLSTIAPALTGLRSWVSENKELASTITLSTLAISGLMASLGGLAFILPGLVSGFRVLMGPLGWVAMAVTGLTTAVAYFTVKTAAARGEMEKQRQEAERLAEQKAKEQEQTVLLADKYERLTAALAGTKEGSAENKEISKQLTTTKEALKDLLPDVVAAIDSETGAIEINTDKLNANKRAAELALLARRAGAMWEAQSVLQKAEGALREQQDRLDRWASSGTPLLSTEHILGPLEKAVEQARESFDTLYGMVLGNSEVVEENEEKQKQLGKALESVDFALKMLDKQWEIDQATILANASETEKLAAKKDYLGKKLALVNAQLSVAQSELKATSAKYGDNSTEAQKAALAVMELRAQQAQLGLQINQTTLAIDEQTKAIQWQDVELQKLDRQWEYDQVVTLANATATEKLTAEKGHLNDELYLLSSKLIDARIRLDEVTQKYGENSEQARAATDAVRELEIQQSKTQTRYDETTAAIQKQNKAIDDQIEKLRALGRTAEDVYGDSYLYAMEAVKQGLITMDQAKEYGRSAMTQKVGPEALQGAWESLKETYYAATPERQAEMFRIKYGAEPPGMGTGGVVKATPGGKVIRVAEAGQDEAIIPLGGGGRGALGQQIVIQIEFNGAVYGILDFEQRVTQTIRDAIQGGAFRGVIATP